MRTTGMKKSHTTTKLLPIPQSYIQNLKAVTSEDLISDNKPAINRFGQQLVVPSPQKDLQLLLNATKDGGSFTEMAEMQHNKFMKGFSPLNSVRAGQYRGKVLFKSTFGQDKMRNERKASE